MADTSAFSSIAGNLIGNVFSSILWFGIGILIVSVLGGLMWFFLLYRKKFDIKVKIISRRAGERNRLLFDKAAIIFDKKSKSKFFRIWGLKVDLPIPKFEVLQSTNQGDYLEIYRKSEDEFYFLTPPVINKERIIKSDGQLHPISDQEHTQIDTDISYWQTKRKSANKGMFDTEHLLMKIIPYIPQIMGGVITIFILYVLMNSLPQVLSALKDLTVELRSLKGGSAISAMALYYLKWNNPKF